MTREFLGRGWAFPVRVGPRGGLLSSAGEQDIEQAIWIVLATAPGERQMLPQFGCGIHDLVFAPNTPGTHGAVAHQVRQALNRWEPRIDLIDVRVEADPGTPGLLLIAIDYRVRSTNSALNLVYPFFIREGEGG